MMNLEIQIIRICLYILAYDSRL